MSRVFECAQCGCKQSKNDDRGSHCMFCGTITIHMDQDLESNKVTDPDHYTRFAIQPITFILANRLGFAEGSAIKYVCRYPFKGGIDDLKKAKRCIEFLIEKEEKRDDNE